MLDSLLSSLKTRQFEAIKHTQPPQLILAEGAGKTTTITAKSAYLVEMEGIDPSLILASLYTKMLQSTCVKKQTRVQNLYLFKNE